MQKLAATPQPRFYYFTPPRLAALGDPPPPGEGDSASPLGRNESIRLRPTQKNTELGQARVRRGMRGDSYSCSPRCIMQERCLWSCWTPQVDWLIFPASPLQSRTPSPACRSCHPRRVARNSASPARKGQARPPIPPRCICSHGPCSVSFQFLSFPGTPHQRALQEIVEPSGIAYPQVCRPLAAGTIAKLSCPGRSREMQAYWRVVRGRAQTRPPRAARHTSCCRC